MSAISKMAKCISEDLLKRLPGQRATQRRKLSELAAGMLVCQTPNLMELSNVLDRPTDCPDARYNYVERFLKNDLVDCGAVMAAYARELLERLAKHQHTLILMIDQTKINDGNELLTVSVRVRKRAVPLLWKAKDTKGGGMGFDEQEKLLGRRADVDAGRDGGDVGGRPFLRDGGLDFLLPKARMEIPDSAQRQPLRVPRRGAGQDLGRIEGGRRPTYRKSAHAHGRRHACRVPAREGP